ncbi:hypothetical protein [Rhodococcus sp. NPDC058521]|uniref:hypothetical protein n=1 Tax=Rhodococcus sp. NPDC058521 TaxID=3346536 RepID=UPI0036603507
MILKTYARLFVASLDDAIPTLEAFVGRPADLRFWADDPALLDPIVGQSLSPLPPPSTEVEQAAVGDFSSSRENQRHLPGLAWPLAQ